MRVLFSHNFVWHLNKWTLNIAWTYRLRGFAAGNWIRSAIIERLFECGSALKRATWMYHGNGKKYFKVKLLCKLWQSFFLYDTSCVRNVGRVELIAIFLYLGGQYFSQDDFYYFTRIQHNHKTMELKLYRAKDLFPTEDWLLLLYNEDLWPLTHPRQMLWQKCRGGVADCATTSPCNKQIHLHTLVNLLNWFYVFFQQIWK